MELPAGHVILHGFALRQVSDLILFLTMPHPDSFPPHSPRPDTLPPPSFRDPYVKPKNRPKLIAKSYEFTREQIDEILKDEIREQLDLPPNTEIKLSYKLQEVGGDPLDRFPGYKDVTGITILIE